MLPDNNLTNCANRGETFSWKECPSTEWFNRMYHISVLSSRNRGCRIEYERFLKKYISFPNSNNFLERIKFENSSIYTWRMYIFNLKDFLKKKKKRARCSKTKNFLKWKISLFYIFSDVKSTPSTIVTGNLAQKVRRRLDLFPDFPSNESFNFTFPREDETSQGRYPFREKRSIDRVWKSMDSINHPR